MWQVNYPFQHWTASLFSWSSALVPGNLPFGFLFITLSTGALSILGHLFSQRLTNNLMIHEPKKLVHVNVLESRCCSSPSPFNLS